MHINKYGIPEIYSYATRSRSFFTPSTDSEYTFMIKSDSNAMFYVSKNEDPSVKVFRICYNYESFNDILERLMYYNDYLNNNQMII